MRVGSVIKKGPGESKTSVKHIWRELSSFPGKYKTDCSNGSVQGRRQIDFNSKRPPCKACAIIHLRRYAASGEALAKLGVK